MILGLDIGFGYVNTSEGIKFKSRINTKQKLLEDNSSIKINYDNKNYYVGEGRNDINLNRIDNKLIKVCAAAAISLSSNERDFYIVTGLPIGIYKENKDKFKDSFKNMEFDIFYNNKKRHRIINIKDVIVFPQAAAIKYYLDSIRKDNSDLNNSLEGIDLLIVDIGFKTLDICMFESYENTYKIKSFSTRELGINELYKRIIDYINDKYGIILEVDQGEKILKNKFFYNSKEGIKQQIDLDFILREMSQDILNEIYNYPLDSAKIILAGGGSYIFNDYINSNIKGVFQIEKGEFANSFGYKKIGQIYFKEK